MLEHVRHHMVVVGFGVWCVRLSSRVRATLDFALRRDRNPSVSTCVDADVSCLRLPIAFACVVGWTAACTGPVPPNASGSAPPDVATKVDAHRLVSELKRIRPGAEVMGGIPHVRWTVGILRVPRCLSGLAPLHGGMTLSP